MNRVVLHLFGALSSLVWFLSATNLVESVFTRSAWIRGDFFFWGTPAFVGFVCVLIYVRWYQSCPVRVQFSIRDLIWLTAVAAVLIAWWLDHGRLRQRFEDAELDQIRLPSSDLFEIYETELPENSASDASDCLLSSRLFAD
jgi:hypothetical protein